jgi:ubiquinone/menaquinone biosynthesis C-methylase UbiE
MERPDWYYDDIVQVGLDFDDEAEVSTYDDRQQGSVAEDRALLMALRLKPGDVMADIGCGTGLLACEAASLGARVHAIDVSKPMLERLRQRAASLNLSELTTQHAGFLSFTLPDESLDLVTSKFALHHLPDFWKAMALARIHTALKPGGRLFIRDVVFSSAPRDLPAAVEGWIEWMLTNTGYAREAVACHVREEHSTFGWVMEGLIKSAGFMLERADYGAEPYADYVAVKTPV